MTSLEAKLKAVEDVEIDSSGIFKYILIRVHAFTDAEEKSKYIVRGYKWAGYHADIYDRVDPGIEALGLSCECVGGGRIDHNADQKKILVYGYSIGFGKADHSITVKTLSEKYPEYAKISFTDEGY